MKTPSTLMLLLLLALGTGAQLIGQTKAFVFDVLAGQPPAENPDGTGNAATFNEPMGVAADASGNIYVADQADHTIRKITPAGVVTTIAGLRGEAGSVDGTGSEARFNEPNDVAVDASGNLYVADTGNDMIRKITPAGVVTTLAGSAGLSGTTDGTGSAARFNAPLSLKVGGDGHIYVADTNNHTIRRVTAAGAVTTIAGQGLSSGTQNGNGSAARFHFPSGLAIASDGTIYIADRGNSTVRKLEADGDVTVFAGQADITGSADGTGGAARFESPMRIGISADGDLYVSDTNNYAIRKITAAGVVTTWAGSPGNRGVADGVGAAARFTAPYGVAVDPSGNVFVAEFFKGTIRKITPAAAVSTFAGILQSVDGPVETSRLYEPRGVELDASGNLYIADSQNHTIRKIDTGGTITTLAGLAGAFGTTNGTGSAARFYFPYDVAVDGSGNIYVADFQNHAIRKVSAAGAVSTFAGTPGIAGTADGTGTAARFNHPASLAADAAGNVYVADMSNSAIRKITPAGVVTTLAGTTGSPGSADGVGAAARFAGPTGIALDSAGNVYVADTSNHTIRKVTTGGVVTTIAGTAGASANVDGVGAAARFNQPSGIIVGTDGQVYVSDSENHTIRRIATDGTVTTIGGTGVAGAANGSGAAAEFSSPMGLALSAGGLLYVADSGNSTIRRGRELLAPTITWAQPAAINEGTALSATQLNATSDVAGSFTYDPPAGTVLAAGTHSLTATFTPTDTNTYASGTASVTLTVNSIEVTGTYFGTIAGGHGEWAMLVRADRSAVFIAHISNRSSVAVVNLSVQVDGTFSATSSERKTTSAGAGAAFTLSGQILAGAVTGQLDGLGETFVGTRVSTGNFAGAGYYAGLTIGTEGGESHTLVGSSGQTLTVIATPARVDAVSGTTNADGSFSATATSGAAFQQTITTSNGRIHGTLTPSGGTAVVFAGLEESVDSTTRLIAISTRSSAGREDRTLIMGFVVVGSGTKEVVVRGVGPSLVPLGVNGALQDPQLLLYRGSSVIEQNDNWGGSTEMMQTFARLGMSPALPADSKDAALLEDIDPGLYTAHVTTGAEANGIALVEVYDSDTASTSRFTALSTRSVAGTGENVLIAGVVLTGNAPKRLLIRGVGPSLVSSGVTAGSELVDPQLSVFSGSTVIAQNDNWGGSAVLKTAFSTVGLGNFDSDTSKDAALSVTVEPGVYTVHVSGVNNTSGVALVEIYEMP